jgi:UDP-glucose 4-epimerase
VSGGTRYVITGMSGGLGRALAARLPSGDITAIDRMAPPPRLVGRFVQGDVAEMDFAGLFGPESVVFHLAAVVHTRPDSQSDVRQTYRVNTDATARIAAAAREAGARLVFVSSVAVFGGDRTGAPLSEDDMARPETDYGKSKLLAEDAIRAEGTRGLAYTILRFPLLYGPRGRGNMERMLRAIGRRAYWPIGDQSIPKSTLYFDDAAAALLLAAGSPAAHNGTFIASPRVAPTLGQIHEAAYRAMGRWRPPAIPAPAARRAARAADTLLGLLARRTRLAQQVEALTTPATFDGSRFSEATTFEPKVAIGEGLARTVAWLRGGGG